MTTKSITELPALVEALPPAERQRFERLFQVTAAEGQLVPPAEMRIWIERQFGSLRAVEHQHIVRVTNRWTFEGALFNPLRARRPTSSTSSELDQDIESSRGDAFCEPETQTPAAR